MASLASKIAPHGLQLELAEGPFVDGDKTLLDTASGTAVSG